MYSTLCDRCKIVYEHVDFARQIVCVECKLQLRFKSGMLPGEMSKLIQFIEGKHLSVADALISAELANYSAWKVCEDLFDLGFSHGKLGWGLNTPITLTDANFVI